MKAIYFCVKSQVVSGKIEFLDGHFEVVQTMRKFHESEGIVCIECDSDFGKAVIAAIKGDYLGDVVGIIGLDDQDVRAFPNLQIANASTTAVRDVVPHVHGRVFALKDLDAMLWELEAPNIIVNDDKLAQEDKHRRNKLGVVTFNEDVLSQDVLDSTPEERRLRAHGGSPRDIFGNLKEVDDKTELLNGLIRQRFEKESQKKHQEKVGQEAKEKPAVVDKGRKAVDDSTKVVRTALDVLFDNSPRPSEDIPDDV